MYGVKFFTIIDLASDCAVSKMGVHVAFLAFKASTVHLVMEEFPSKPGVNWSTTEKGSMLDTASRDGGDGKTGSTPD